MRMERQFRRQVDQLGEVFSFVDEFSGAAQIGTSSLFPLRLAIEEVFVNMVTHNPGGNGEIGISLLRDGDQLVAQLRDPDTEQYDITKHEATGLDAPLNDRAPGGLGIHLVNRLMDEVEYAYSGREAHIRLVKHLSNDHAQD